MMILPTFLSLILLTTAAPAPQADPSVSASICGGNTAEDRSTWCDYSIDTDWYLEAPDTGVTVEVGPTELP